MRHKNSRKTVAKKRRAGGTCPLFGMDINMLQAAHTTGKLRMRRRHVI